MPNNPKASNRKRQNGASAIVPIHGLHNCCRTDGDRKTGDVPNLGLDDLVVDLEGAGGELDPPDGGLGLEAELVAGEAGEQVGLADAGLE